MVSTLITLDGVMEAPAGEPGHPHTGWAAEYIGEEEIGLKYQEVLDSDVLPVGRVTYESFAGAWPAYEGELADRMNSTPKYVVSNTPTDPEWTNTKVISGGVLGQIRQLKAQSGKPIVVGGSRTLSHTLINEGLIDEIRLMIFPVIVGSGLRLFPESPDKVSFRLKETRAFASGVVEQKYERG